MRRVFLPAMMAGLFAAGGALAQTPPTEEVGLPLVQGTVFDDTCGPRPQYQGKAVCVRGSLAGITPIAETYIAHFKRQGWDVVGGEANGVVFARRRADGNCDGMEMAVYYDQARAPTLGTPSWIAFAPIPGSVCKTGVTAQ